MSLGDDLAAVSFLVAVVFDALDEDARDVGIELRAGAALDLADGDVVVASGGARGVTAACLIEWARSCRARFVLLGRSALAVEPAECAGIADEAGLKRVLLASAQARGEALTPAALQARLTALLARSAGHAGMAGGQAIDLASIGKPLDEHALRDMHRRKTGALLGDSVELGAACGQAPDAGQARWLASYAQAIGLAFQVVNDILDVVGDAAALGKTAGKDAEQGKPTYVSVLGLAASRQLADTLLFQARDAVAALGPRARRLGDIAELIVLRQS